MALNFPDSPILNQVYTDTTSGFSFKWDGTVWQSFSPQSTKEILILDDISGSFNDSTVTFALTESGNPVYPVNAQQLRIVLGGVVQTPITDYTISQSDITFTTAPSSGLTFSGVSLGPAVPIGSAIVADGSITPIKLSTGGPSWNTDGDVYISGIATITNALGSVKVGVGTTTLIVEGDARVTGILTVGTSSITLDGNTNTINAENIVGTAATFNGNVSIAGTLTYEDVTNVDSVGLVTARAGAHVATTSGNLLVATTSATGTSSQPLQVTGGAYFSGLVGIGTTNPTLDLQLSPDARISNLNASIALSSTAGTAATVAQFYHYNGNGSYLRIKATRLSNGSSWTTASTKLLQVIDVTEMGYIEFNPSGGNYGMAFGQGSNEYMRILNGGNVGIATENPTEKLHVIGNVIASGNVSGYSDKSLKDNIQTIPNALDKVSKLRGVEFDRNDIEGNPHQIGVIAQEVEEIIPEVITTHNDGLKSVAYGNLVGLLIEAIKDLKEEVNELKARLEEK